MSIKCGICGKEFKDGMFDEYSIHVKNCAYEAGLKKKTEDMKKINAELEEVKRAKTVYEGLRDSFKEMYPDIYKTNFKDEINNGINKDNKDKSGKRKEKYSFDNFIDEKYSFDDFVDQEKDNDFKEYYKKILHSIPDIYLHMPDEPYRHIDAI